jgi:CDP-glycerol glycerophosphotransferase (TagB/SpsB family)
MANPTMNKVYIFGAGDAGKHVYSVIKDTFNVIAFIDNDINKKGLTLYQKPIHHPTKFLLSNIEYELIIIASEYFPGIYSQLTKQCDVDKNKIRIAKYAQKEVILHAPLNKDISNRVAFFIHNADLFHHFDPVLEKLPRESFDILIFGSILERKKIKKMAISRGYKLVDVESIEISDQKYQAIVSNHFLIPVIKNLSHFHIRFMYALGKENHNFSSWNNNYDLILCFGPYQVDKMKPHNSATFFQMGYPRYDKYFKQPYDKKTIQKELKLDTNKKTIIWLPTWLELSSIDLFCEKISSLSKNYNVVVKCHPLSKHHEPQRVQKLENFHFSLVISEVYDNLKLFSVADFVISDYGGTAFGALYLDKNLLLVNVPNPERDLTTGSNSPDVLLRKDIINFDLSESCNIEKTLNDKHHWESQKQIRKKLRDKYFIPSYGFSSDLAALAIINHSHIIEAQK